MANKVCTKTPMFEDGSVFFEFADGTTIEVRVDQFSESVQRAAMVHGFNQKLGDAFAGSQGSVAVALEKFHTVLNTLKSGEWNSKRASTGGILAEALHRETGNGLDECIAVVGKMDKATAKDARKALEVTIRKIELERAEESKTTEGFDVEALFDQ